MTRKRGNHELRHLENVLGLNPYTASFPQIASRIKDSPEHERAALISLCEDVLGNRFKRSREDMRVSAVKLLVALFPATLDNITRWLERNSEGSLYEVHFSLFCFLDQVPGLSGAKSFAFHVPVLIGNYLNQVRSETAHAAWMAGDLLGDHWDGETALPVLIEAAEKAKFVAGRLGAIHGLSHILTRLKSSKRAMVIRLLHKISRADKSRGVRSYAELVLKRLQENQPPK